MHRTASDMLHEVGTAEALCNIRYTWVEELYYWLNMVIFVLLALDENTASAQYDDR